ncbi:hypothetical protein [uncultured Jannaschia sp.]|uniref:hypothetical protein n=1 Tax=uncultured Jannaschia sp. TaxID=293347 RepID=UPI00260A3A76|nr:hypothetical protein [uncultured Jannaschia sp.]
MTMIVYRETEEMRQFRDAQEIVDRLEGLGYRISLRDAHCAWKSHSETMEAGWLVLPEDDGHLLSSIRSHCDEM